MKPENVFLQRTSDGEDIVKIVDFGIAQLRTNEEAAAGEKKRRLTRTGMIFGTPEYMSPEQAAGRHADLRADVYAVGIILYEMFTGAVPFTGETFLGVLAKHLNETPPAMTAVYPELALSEEFQSVIYRALEKNPDARFQTMGELSQALQATPEGRGVVRGSRDALASSRTEYHEYQEVPTGAFTSPQFRDREAASRAPTAPGVTLSQSGAGAVSMPDASGRLDDASTRARMDGVGATTVAPSSSRSGVVLGVVALALAAGGGLLFLTRGNVEPATAVAPEAAPAAPTPPTAAAPAPSPVVPVAPAPAHSASVTAASVVRLAVTTEPPGATLLKDGFQVCDSTPCEVTAAPNETLELEAVKGAQKGKAKVLAQRDQNVNIKLVGGAAGPKPTAKPAREGRLCEVEVDGIKILRPCK
jgi:serine/threonine-protein kinase